MTEFNSKAEAEAATIASSVRRIEILFHMPNYDLPRTLAGGASYKRISLADIGSQTDLNDVLLYAPLNGVVGSAPVDHGPDLRTLTLSGNATITSTHLMFGCNAAYFDGVQDYVSVPNSTDWNFANDFTVDFYARFEDLAAPRALFAFGDNSTNLYYLIADTNGSLNFKQLEANSPTINISTPAGAVAEDTDYHIALVRAGDGYTIYVNGIKQGGAPNATPIRTNSTNPLSVFRIGHFGSIGHMKGWISRFRITNAARWLHVFDPLKSYKYYPDEAYFRSADRYLPGGSSDSAYGGYWLLDVAAAGPMMFGAVGDGVTDDANALQACRDFCFASGAVMALDRFHAHVGAFEITSPIIVRGSNRGSTGINLVIDREKKGVHILASNCTFEQMTVSSYSPNNIQNGQGDNATCFTVGRVHYPEVRDGDDKLVHPPVLTGNVLRDLDLIRPPKSKGGHAIVYVGRVGGLLIEDILFQGYDSPTDPADNSYFGDAILCHWGMISDDFPLDSDGIVIEPLIMRRPDDADAYTYHPNGLTARRLRLRNTGRLYAHSASYNIDIGDVDIDGGATKVVTQIVNLTVGDDADGYAHPDDKGKVYSNISIHDVVAWNIDGRSPNEAGRSLFDWPGGSSSKYANADGTLAKNDPFTQINGYNPNSLANGASYTYDVTVAGATMGAGAAAWFSKTPDTDYGITAAVVSTNTVRVTFSNNTGATVDLPAGTLTVFVPKQRVERAPEWTGCSFYNWRLYGIGETEDLFNIRNGRIFANFDGIQAKGVGNIDGMQASRLLGRLNFRNCEFPGKVELRYVDGVSFDNCKFANTNIVSITLGSIANFSKGDTVAGSLSGAVGDVYEILGGNVLLVRLSTAPWHVFQVGETVGNGGLGSSTVQTGGVNVAGNRTVLILGETLTATPQSTLQKGGTQLLLDGTGFPDDIRIGDKITYSGGVVYVTRYADDSENSIAITPAPAIIETTHDLTLDRFSRNIEFNNCEFLGGGIGLDVSNSYGVRINGGVVRDCGQYGVLIDVAATVDMDGTTFSNNGLWGVELASDPSTRDIIVGEGGTLRADKLIFKDSQRVQYNVVVDNDAAGGHLRDSIFVPIGADEVPNKAYMYIATDKFDQSNNRDAAGILYAAQSVSYDPPPLLTGTSATKAIFVPGARVNDTVSATFDTPLDGVTMTASVTGVDVVSVVFQNSAGSTKNLNSGALAVVVSRP